MLTGDPFSPPADIFNFDANFYAMATNVLPQTQAIADFGMATNPFSGVSLDVSNLPLTELLPVQQEGIAEGHDRSNAGSVSDLLGYFIHRVF